MLLATRLGSGMEDAPMGNLSWEERKDAEHP